MKTCLLGLCMLACAGAGHAAWATTLAPGQTLQVSSLPTAEILLNPESTVVGSFLYERPASLPEPHRIYYGGLHSTPGIDALGRTQIRYSLISWGVGAPPEALTDWAFPTIPNNATISIAGFKSLTLDVAAVPIYSVFQAVSRSNDGDVVTFTKFTGDGSTGYTDQIVLTIPDATILPSTATGTWLDYDGSLRSLEVAALVPAPVPEPVGAALLLMGVAGLLLRFRRRI